MKVPFSFYVVCIVPGVLSSFEYYVNDFLDPAIVLDGNWGNATSFAQESVTEWANFLSAQGPWCTWHIVCSALRLIAFHSRDYIQA
jgi:hypothetical protein